MHEMVLVTVTRFGVLGTSQVAMHSDGLLRAELD
jgi:hypothetical protein